MGRVHHPAHGGGAGASSLAAHRDTVAAVGLAIAAAVAIKVPELFGLRMHGPDADASFYLRNISLLVLPFLAGFFALKRNVHRREWYLLALPFVAAGLIVNLLPFKPEGHTLVLAAIHLPIALWLAIGFAYAGGRWRAHEQRMNFVRFSGEWFIYYTLIALGGGILMAFTVFIFQAIGLNAEPAVVRWVLPCGAVGAVLIAAWLVESKQSAIENMAPVLTLLFTPLFAVLLLIFVATMIWTGNAIDIGREVLIGFDLLLVLVLCALLVDVLALWAMVERTSEFGFSPNKTAALGLNLLLLVNLGWSAVLYAGFLAKRSPFTRLERWQTAYLPVYAVWAWIVTALFPIIFNYQ